MGVPGLSCKLLQGWNSDFPEVPESSLGDQDTGGPTEQATGVASVGRASQLNLCELIAQHPAGCQLGLIFISVKNFFP